MAGWGGKKALGISGKANFVENTPNFSSGYDYNFFCRSLLRFRGSLEVYLLNNKQTDSL